MCGALPLFYPLKRLDPEGPARILDELTHPTAVFDLR